MFTDEKTLTTIYANLNDSVSPATLRPQDLIPVFLDVIRDTAEYAQMNLSGDLAVITDAGASDSDERWDSEEVSYFLNETLFDILNDYAPEGYYFSSNEGDGADFGYWKLDEEDEYEEDEFYYEDDEDISQSGYLQITVYSNYDCAPSYEEYSDGGYLYHVQERVKKGITKEAFMEEFRNGSYGGMLLAFIVEVDDIEHMKDMFRHSEQVMIPEGTVFGFWNGQGSATAFDSVTTKDMWLPIKKSTYDCLKAEAIGDTYTYSLEAIFGGFEVNTTNELKFK